MDAFAPYLATALRTGLWLLSWLLLLTLIFAPLEQLFAVRRRKLLGPSLADDLGFFVLNSLLPPLLLALPVGAATWLLYNLVPGRVHAAIESWPIWARGLAAFVLADFGFYWGHRGTHQIPFLWRFHAVHHAPKDVYFLISARAHPIDNAFIRLCGLVPIAVLGLGAPQSVKGTLVATLLMLAVTVWGFFIHANVRWRFGPLEWLLATPAFHHWHHTLDQPRDRNFASMLPVWDWLFGTHHQPHGEWPAAYGIDDQLADSIAGQLVQPFLPPPRPAVEAARRTGVG